MIDATHDILEEQYSEAYHLLHVFRGVYVRA